MPQFQTGFRRDSKFSAMSWVLVIAALLNGIVVLEYGYYSAIFAWGRWVIANDRSSVPDDMPDKKAEEEKKRVDVIAVLEKVFIATVTLAVSHALLAVCLFLLPRRNTVSLIITSGVCCWLFLLKWLSESVFLDWETLVVVCSIGVAVASRFAPDDKVGQNRR